MRREDRHAIGSALMGLASCTVVTVIAVAVAAAFFWSVVGDLFPSFPDSGVLPAVVALMLAVLGAPVVHRSGRGLMRLVLLLLAFAAALLVVVQVPGGLPPSMAPLAVPIRVVLVLAVGFLLSKMILLYRFSALHGSRVVRHPRDLERLLPFQEEDLGELRRAVLAGDAEDGSQVVQLVGRWGDGKSFLLERLEAFLERARRAEGPTVDPCAVVLVNVWEQQSEPDLHLAIVEQVLSHRKYWYPFGWLQLPLSLYLTRIVKEAKLAVSTGKSFNAKIELPITLPQATGKRPLQRLVAHVRARGTRTIVVLDEIDRAAPPIAQAAVTLALRSLDLPGVVVVLAYVDELMRYKAFNPLVGCLPDLASTMSAVIYAEGPERAVLGAPGGPLDGLGDLAIARWSAWIEAGTPGAAGDRARDGTSPTRRDRLDDALRTGFANADHGKRQRLQVRFAEKYLGTRPVQLQGPSEEDVVTMILSFDHLAAQIEELVGFEVRSTNQTSKRGTNGGPSREALAKTIRDAIQSYRDPSYQDKSAETAVPPVRALDGELFRRLSGVHARGTVSPQFVAAVVLAAFDATVLHGGVTARQESP